ncbi:hypothetical protein EJA10_11680 [Mesobacillus subterraneus]|uniref:YwdI family protein n=2 Tax=Mesobacillus subterraneus TaxID=285983 RepID=A0A3R9E6I5_9BACI|nr:hypothetical protein EJA10_11680 [Mesobacillus subterraneus]
MNISLQKLLAKMEDEIRRARTAETETAQRERIHSIKTLCELVLDEPTRTTEAKVSYNAADPQATPQFVPAQSGFTQQHMPVAQPTMPQPKKLEMEDNANGDSLFDF